MEKPPDSKAFAEVHSVKFEGESKDGLGDEYGVIKIEKEQWVLAADGAWEIWSCFPWEDKNSAYLIYFPSVFHGIIFDRVNEENQAAALRHSIADVNILLATSFKAMETLHILEEVLKIKGLRKQMVHNYMNTLKDSLLKEIEISGMKLLESLTASAILVRRAAPIHSRIVKVITSACYAKTK